MPYCKNKDKAFLAIRKYLRGSVVMPRGFALGPTEAAVRASAGSFLKQMSDAEISSTAKGTMPEWFTLDVARTAMVPIVGKTIVDASVAAAVLHPVVERNSSAGCTFGRRRRRATAAIAVFGSEVETTRQEQVPHSTPGQVARRTPCTG
jgi:hypothetical protein